MKKNALIILAALLFCTACQSNPAGSASDNSEPTSSTAPVNSGSSEPDKPAQTSENANAEEGNPTEITEQSSTAETSGTAESTGDAFFKPGIWQCSEYYFYEFYADGTGGIVKDFDCYMGQPFRYEVTDSDSGALMFHIFSADDQSPAAAKIISDTEIELTWDFGRTDTLTYLPGKTMDELDAEFKNYFKPGTWSCNNESYYFFNEDGASGDTLSFDRGIGVGFSYEVMSRSQGFVNFHQGSADVSSGVVVSDKTEDSFTLTWENGRSQNFMYVSPLGYDEFKFYTDEQLYDIVLKYYQTDNNNYIPTCLSIQHNSDGTTTIHLFDLVVDKSSTAALCTLDRITLKGTDDITGKEVDFSEYA